MKKVNVKYVLGVVLALCFTTLLFTTPKQAEAVGGTWHNYGYGWWYEREDGSYPSDQWENIYGTWYYFNGDGYAHCGDYAWINNAWYAFNWDCSMCEGWVYDGGYHNFFYAQPGSGYLHTSCWSWIDGHWYGFNADGQMTKGWTKDSNGTWYYCAPYSGPQTSSGYNYPEGAMYWSDWAWDNGYCYYLWGNGAMATNCWVGGYWIDGNGHWSPSGETFVPLSDQDRDDAIAYLNEVRASYGLAPVVLDDAMQTMAQIKSDDMAKHGYDSHKMLYWGNGTSYMSSILRVYLNNNVEREPGTGVGIGNSSECIAGGQNSYVKVIDAWLNSPSHSKTMLDPKLVRIGLAANTIPNTKSDTYGKYVFTYCGYDYCQYYDRDGNLKRTAIPFDENFPTDAAWWEAHA